MPALSHVKKGAKVNEVMSTWGFGRGGKEKTRMDVAIRRVLDCEVREEVLFAYACTAASSGTGAGLGAVLRVMRS